MEKRTSIEVEEVATTLFEAVLKQNDSGMIIEEVKTSLLDLEIMVNVYLKDPKYSLVSVEKVERYLVKLTD